MHCASVGSAALGCRIPAKSQVQLGVRTAMRRPGPRCRALPGGPPGFHNDVHDGSLCDERVRTQEPRIVEKEKKQRRQRQNTIKSQRADAESKSPSGSVQCHRPSMPSQDQMPGTLSLGRIVENLLPGSPLLCLSRRGIRLQMTRACNYR